MLKILWKAIGLAPVVLSAVSVLTNTVYADEVPVVQMAPELMTTAADPANLTLEPLIHKNCATTISITTLGNW